MRALWWAARPSNLEEFESHVKSQLQRVIVSRIRTLSQRPNVVLRENLVPEVFLSEGTSCDVVT